MKLIIVLLGITSLLAACGGGGGTGAPLGTYCKANHDPIPLEEKDVEVVEVDDLKDGEYTFEASELYYINLDRDIRIHVTYTKNKDDEYEAIPVCVGGTGITSDMEAVSFEVDLVSELSQKTGQRPLIKTKTASFDLRPRPKGEKWLSIEYKDLDNVGRSGKISDYYKASKSKAIDNIEQKLVYKTDSETHLRSRFTINEAQLDNPLKIQIGVKLTKK